MSALITSGGGTLSLASRLISVYPSTALAFFNTNSNPAGGISLFKQSTTTGSDRNIGMALDENGTTSYGIHRNTGGSPQSIAVLSSTRNNSTWYAARVRFNSASSVDITVGAVGNFASDTTTVTDDLSLMDQVIFGTAMNGQIAELAIFNGVAVSDTDYNAYKAGTVLAENMTGVTFAASLLTIGSGATTYTATTGQVLTINGTVTQGSSHPIARSTPVPVSFSGPVPTRNGVLGTSTTFANAGFFAGNLTPFTYSSVGTALPAGVTLNTSTGVLTLAASGATAGTTSGIIIRATDTGSNVANTNAYSIVIAATNAAPTFPGNISNISGNAGTAITPVNVSGQFSDTDALTYSASPAGTAWPSGLIVNSSTGIISGTVASASTTNGLKVRASDTNTPTANTVDSNAFNVVIASAGASVTITSPIAGGKRAADGAYRASVACNVTALDKTTHAVLERKTGLTSPASGAFTYTSTVLTAGTERLFLVKADADDKDLGAFFATPV